MDTPQIVSLISNISSSGILAIVVLWLGPKVLKQRTAEMEALIATVRSKAKYEREMCERYLAAISSEVKRQGEVNHQLIVQLTEITRQFRGRQHE